MSRHTTCDVFGRHPARKRRIDLLRGPQDGSCAFAQDDDGAAGRHREPHSRAIDRRSLLLGAGAGLLVLSLPRRALARPALDEAVRAFTGGAEPKSGRVHLDIPPLLENGNAVGVTVRVDSPMTAEDHVRRIALFNEKNPQADVAVFHLGPRAGTARVSTRIRLATSQAVVAVAEMTDGSFWSSRESVIVTLAACIEDLS